MSQGTSDAKPDRHWDMFLIVSLLAQAGLAVLFGVFTVYGSDVISATQSDVNRHATFYVDIASMIFVGFGFLMTFMKKASYSSLVMTFIVAVFVIQWAMLTQGFGERAVSGRWGNIIISMPTLIDALFAAAAILISLGGIIGKITPQMLLFMAFFETMFYSLNFNILMGYLEIADIGGGLTIHVFGAGFGLAAAFVLTPREAVHRQADGINPTYMSDIFSMVGTLFLWIYWPSFNGALAVQGNQLMAITNTLLSLCGCTFVAIVLSRWLRGDQRIHMVDVQNATLAGGVTMGCIADTPLNPGVAIACGMGAGVISIIGFVYLQPLLEKRGLRDSCGINNLHFMPGIYGAFISVICSATYQLSGSYGANYATFFKRGLDHPKWQLAGIVISISLGIVSGLLTALLTKLVCRRPALDELFTDSTFFHMPDDFVEFEDKPLEQSEPMKLETPADAMRGAVSPDIDMSPPVSGETPLDRPSEAAAADGVEMQPLSPSI